MEGSQSANMERLEYLYLNLVGQVVQVRLVDDTSVEGLFVSCTDNDTGADAGIVVCCTRNLSSSKRSSLSPSEVELNEGLIIPYKSILMVEVPNAKVRTETAGRVDTGRTDFGNATFDWADDGVNELLEDEPHQTGAWNQFEANEKSFGVKTTYKEELYTTRLDHTKITEEDRLKAELIARDIESSSPRGIAHRMEREECLRDDEGLDEGQLYSDVLRPQEKKTPYAPPSAAGRKTANEVPPVAAPSVPPVPPPAAAVGPAVVALPITTTAVSPPPAAAGMADDSSVRHKRFNEDPHQLPYDPNQTSAGFNLAAAPYTPMKSETAITVVDFVATLADAISGNEMCYECQPQWPGTNGVFYDQDDSSYSQQNYDNNAMAPNHGMSIPMYANPHPGMPNMHKGYQIPVGRGHHNQPMPLNPMQGQGFHHELHHHHHQTFHGMGGYPPQPQHPNPPVQEYVPHKGQPGGGLPRSNVRPGKGGASSRVEPQQPVSANTASSPPPVPTVDSAPNEVKHPAKLQRGRGMAAFPKGDMEGDPGIVANPPGGSKKRGGK